MMAAKIIIPILLAGYVALSPKPSQLKPTPTLGSSPFEPLL